MPISPIGTVSGAKPTLLARGVKYRVFGPSGGGALNPTYQALGVSALKLTPRLTSESVAYVPRLIGPGDVLIVDGDQYASLINVAPQIPAGPSGALAKFSFLTTPANIYIEPIAPGENVTEITHPHRSAAQIFCPTTVGVRNSVETWTVPNGQRWRLLGFGVGMVIAAASSHVYAAFARSNSTTGYHILTNTGGTSTAGTYGAMSDVGFAFTEGTGATAVAIPDGGLPLTPGDSLVFSYVTGTSTDTITFYATIEVEADA